jgi:hypothetical protein
MDALATHWRLPPDQFPGQPLATVLYCIDDRTVVITEVMLNGRDVLADLPADVVREIERDLARAETGPCGLDSCSGTTRCATDR